LQKAFGLTVNPKKSGKEMNIENKDEMSEKSELIKRRQQYFAGSYLFFKNPVNFVKGQGIWLFDLS
jgi:4-aminobutyrate aminotransferase-like enzyme